MDFGSEFILADDEAEIDTSESEEDDDDDEDGIAGFECEIMDMGNEVEEDHPVRGEKKNITTNTLKIELAKIKEEPDVHLQEKFMTRCNNPDCGAYFSEHDNWEKNDLGNIWQCRFCSGKLQLTSIEDKVNLQSKHDVCYEHIEEQSSPPVLIQDYKIIFVIDNSGSMGRKMQISKKEGTLKNIWSAGSDHQATEPNKEGIEVSWLQAVQATVIDIIDEISQSESNRRIGLITFNDIVTIYGKEKTEDVVGADLENRGACLSAGERNSNLLPISEVKDYLFDVLKGLEDGGRTALGPALMVALGMVHNSRGSRIIVCTDGAANIGFGKLEEGPSKEDEKFYQQLTNKAKVAGASISLISFDQCELKILEKLPRNTGGTVETILPTDLSKPIKEELSKKTIATNVDVTFLVHKDLYVYEKNKENENRVENKSSASLCIGNVTDVGKQSLCFEFAFRNPSQLKAPQQQISNTLQTCPIHGGGQHNIGMGCYPSYQTPTNPNTVNTSQGSPEYPFQIQISYKDENDKVLTRVWTKVCPMTKSREVAQKSMNPDATVTSFVQKCAKEILDLKQKTLQSELKRKAHNIINQAKHHKTFDNILPNPELIKKLDALIDALEELAVSGLSDEVSAMLSKFATKA
ncbi:circularly permutated Ras protein 1 [Biomphalaria pfeifferi]|uniref:Circularly permutated Ras protein 1 n=1 Tax=Biomphalaria pfeifferi TaxID=112525 RepID=A0AAD8BFD4_BIOPF|nr:circularly permutated Ras protein 1 [Biomphalaria pfeifferi]